MIGGVLATGEVPQQPGIDGAGTQYGEPVTITGASNGATMFEVALADGAVVFASGDSELRMTFTGRRKRQDVLQHSRISIIGQ